MSGAQFPDLNNLGKKGADSAAGRSSVAADGGVGRTASGPQNPDGAREKIAKAKAVTERLGGELTQTEGLNPAEIKDIVQGKEDTAGELGKDLLKAGAKGAVKGGSKGSWEAAAIQAGIEMAKVTLKSKTFRRWVLTIIAIVVAFYLVIAISVTALVSSAVTAVEGQADQGSQDAASTAGYTTQAVADAEELVDGLSVPWQLAAVYAQVEGKAMTEAQAKELDGDADDSGLDTNVIELAENIDDDQWTIPDDNQDAVDKIGAMWEKGLQGIGVSSDDATLIWNRTVDLILGQQNSCTADDSGSDSTTVPAGSVQLNASQTKNAQTILGVTKAVVGDTATGRDAAAIAIATAIVESGIQNHANPTVAGSEQLPHEGDGQDLDSVGVFQQRAGWGSVQSRQTVTTATAAFLGGPNGPNHGSPRGLLDVSGWASMAPGVAAQAVQVSKYPDKYAAQVPAAQQIVGALWDSSPAISTGSSSSVQTAGDLNLCGGGTSGAISADQVALAKQIVQYEQQGLVTYWHNPLGDVSHQIDDIANGTATADCQIHAGVLQIIVFAVQTFGMAQVNDLNRTCSGNSTNAAITAHTTGDAVDFGALGSKILEPDQPLHLMTVQGWDANSAALVRLLDPYMPGGSWAGQAQCRANPVPNGAPPGTAPTTVTTVHFAQGADGCSHQHVDEGKGSDVRLNFGTSA